MKKKIEYQKQYFKRDHSYMDPVDSNYVWKLVNRLIRQTKLKTSSKILEVGCGSGRFSIPLLKKGYNLTCIDMSEILLSKFRKKIEDKRKCKLVHCGLKEYANICKEKYDFIIGFYILHHLDNLEESFKDFTNLLKPRGIVGFVEPNPNNFMYYARYITSSEFTLEGERGMSYMRLSILSEIMQRQKFSQIKIKRFGFFPPFIMNIKIFYWLENQLEKINFIDFIRPYQIISGELNIVPK